MEYLHCASMVYFLVSDALNFLRGGGFSNNVLEKKTKIGYLILLSTSRVLIVVYGVYIL